MQIIYLELVGYKRLLLNNIRRFVLRPTERVQLILGTNGSGKSSVIRELTPLPAEKADYSKEGMKLVKILHHGVHFTLKSVFSPSAKHSFERDGEELNPGGTITVQKELVKQYFNINSERHDLLTDRLRFHEMSPSKRREWLTELSDTSFDYALAIFLKLKERSRDTTGALKLAKKRLVAEQSKVISLEEEELLTREVAALQQELSTLQAERAPVVQPFETCFTQQQRILEGLGRLGMQVLKQRSVVEASREYDSLEHIEQLIEENKHAITAVETKINAGVTEHEKLSHTLEVLKRTGSEGVRELTEKLAVMRERRNRALSRRKLGIEGLDGLLASNALESIYESLVGVLTAIPSNETRKFSQENLQVIQQKVLGVKNQLLNDQNQIAKYQAERAQNEAHKHTGEIVCPKCRYGWSPGYSEERHQDLGDAIEQTTTVMTENQKLVAGYELELQEFDEYRKLYGEFARCVKNWPVLTPFWDYLLDNETVINAPRKALSEVEVLRHDLMFDIEAQQINTEIVAQLRLIQQAEEVGDANLVDVMSKLNDVTMHVEELTAQLTKHRQLVSDLTTKRTSIIELQTLAGRVANGIDQLSSGNLEMVEQLRRELVNDCIQNLQISLARKTEVLHAVHLQAGIVKDLETNIGRLALEDESLRLLVKELSPTEGLIAEGLFGFIRNFTGQMNALIRKVWTYPMQVLDCAAVGERGAELDYKFPLMVQSKDNIVPDISGGSSGQTEMVDLAFKIVAMRYMDLSDSPLYLDEFGKALDEEHRFTATAAIKSLLDTQAFTQLFMVSHYEAGYGSFTAAQTCVLDPRNITVPAVYNQHVLID